MSTLAYASSRRKPGSNELVRGRRYCSFGRNLGDPGFRRDDEVGNGFSSATKELNRRVLPERED
jgi:hypothetical protein